VLFALEIIVFEDPAHMEGTIAATENTEAGATYTVRVLESVQLLMSSAEIV